MMNAMIEPQMLQLFENLCVMSGRELERFTYALTRNDPFAAEEIYQNTMLSALKGLKFLRAREKMKIWVFSIAKAEARRYYAARAAAGTGRCTADGETVGAIRTADFTESIEDRECFLALLRGLTYEEKKLYVLRYYYDIPLKEISVMMDANYNTIRSMHRRGMTKMRSRLLHRK